MTELGGQWKICTFGSAEANITRASNGQIDSAPEPGCRQNRRHCQSAVVAGVMLPGQIVREQAGESMSLAEFERRQ